MFTDNLFGGKPPAPGEPRRSPLGNLAASILAVDVKVDRHVGDKTVHVTKAEKAKLDRISEGAEANVQSDWDQSDSDADDFIRNKPTAMKNPAALTFGSKTYDGSAAQTLTAADLGALTSHQDISGKVDSSALFSGGKVKAELLPSYVDDVLEYPSSVGFPSTGEAGKIYVAKDTNKIYRWGGTQYVEISPTPDLSNYVQKEADKGLFSGSYNDLSDKPTIPAAVTVDSALSGTSTNPVQNKVIATALEMGYTAWKWNAAGTSAGLGQPEYDTVISEKWIVSYDGMPWPADETDESAVELHFHINGSETATRTRITPKKTSQLTNDGSDGAHPFISQNEVQHQQLTPVYSQTPTFSEWTILRNDEDVTEQVQQPVYEESDGYWQVFCVDGDEPGPDRFEEPIDINRLTWHDSDDAHNYTATRTRTDIIGYTLGDQTTKPLQPKGDYQPTLTAAQLANIEAVPNKADASSLPYALVDVPVSSTAYAPQALFPLKFSISETPHTVAYGDSGLGVPAQCSGYWLTWSDGTDNWLIAEFAGDGSFDAEGGDIDSGMLRFGADEHAPTSADRIVLPNTAQLADRAINAVSLSAAATLAFPAQTAGKARDFVVRLTLMETNNVVPSVTFPADVSYEIEGGEWPDLTEAGTYIVRLTEVPTASELETARFFLQCSSAVADAEPPSAGGGV